MAGQDETPNRSSSSSSSNPSSNDKKSYKQAASDFYNRQYDSWVPWVEDQYLKWFTKDNKASYGTKRNYPLPLPLPFPARFPFSPCLLFPSLYDPNHIVAK
jgi:hypothetical protein